MPAQQGVSGDHDQFLRHDGTVPLSAGWDAGAFYMRLTTLTADSGGPGLITLGNVAGYLRLTHNANEIIELLGVSNNQANLYLKNLRIADLAGVGNRNVIADVNGDLSAP